MNRRSVFAGLVAAAVAIVIASAAARAGAAPPTTTVPPSPAPAVTVPAPDVTDPSNGLPVARGPLVVLPAGCVSPPAAVAVFEGKIVAAVANTARFKVERVLAGSLGPDEVGGQADVQYGDETRFLSVGSTYVVGVARQEEKGGGTLVSTVREPAPLFAGDAVIGANNSDIACPQVNDPVRTLLPDGTPVDTGVLAPLHGHGASILAALLKPALVALAVLVGLVLVKHLFFATGRAVRDVADSISEQRESGF